MPSDKTPKSDKQRGEYNDKLKVKVSFLDIMKATVKEANDKTEKKKSRSPDFKRLCVNGYSYTRRKVVCKKVSID